MADYATIYDNVNQIYRTGVVMEGSRAMSVQRPYVLLDELDTLKVKNANVVQNLVVVADVAEIQANQLSLPGTNQVLIFCRILQVRSANRVLITVAAQTTQMQIGAQITQNLEVKWPNGSNFLNSWPVWRGNFLSGDYGSNNFDLQTFLANADILLGIQATLLIMETILTFQSQRTETVQAASQYAEWLSTLVPHEGFATKEIQDQLIPIVFRSQTLAKMPLDGSHTTTVPRLRYDSYRNLINALAQTASAYDNEFKDLQRFIQQQQLFDASLLEWNKSFIAKERDMEAFYSQVVSLNQDEMKKALDKVTRLGEQQQELTDEMNKAKSDMEAGLIAYRNRQIASAFFDVAVAIGAVVASFFTGGATAGAAVAAAAKAAESVSKLTTALKKVMEVVEKLQLVMELLFAIKTLWERLEDINIITEAPKMPELPTEADWDIYENSIEEVAASMPTEVTEVQAWKYKCKNVAAVSREMTRTAVYVGQLQQAILVNSMQQEIAHKQAERLESMKPQDLSNYQEQATLIDMRTSRVVLALLNVLILQNGAVRYECLLPPQPLIGWPAMDAVRRILITQEGEIVSSQTILGPPRDYELPYNLSGIPVDLLLDNDDFQFTIPTTDLTFPNSFFKVRIRYVEIQFVNENANPRPTTRTGEVFMTLQASRAFQDRDQSGDELQYDAAVPVTYQYAYELSTGKTTFSNKPATGTENVFMQSTPFSRWRLRLSKSAFENNGLAFPTAAPGDTTQMFIRLFLTVIRRIERSGQ